MRLSQVVGWLVVTVGKRVYLEHKKLCYFSLSVYFVIINILNNTLFQVHHYLLDAEKNDWFVSASMLLQLRIRENDLIQKGEGWEGCAMR